jgi:hypothetical protein
MDQATIVTWSKVLALLALIGYATVHIVRKDGRHKRSPLGIPETKGWKFRYIVLGSLIAIAWLFFYEAADAIGAGRTFVPHGRYTGGNGYYIYRRENSDVFWMLVCGHCFFGLLFLYLSVVEFIFTIKRNKNARKNPAS